MEKLAIFDIDYTLTKKETSMELYKYMVKHDKKLLRHLPSHIITGLFYTMKIYDASKTKERFLRFLAGTKEEELKTLVKDFYRDQVASILYEDGIKAIKDFKKNGYKIYLISASPEFYVNEFYNIKEVDKVIGTKFNMDNGTDTNPPFEKTISGFSFFIIDLASNIPFITLNGSVKFLRSKYLLSLPLDIV